jgi:hypothetical protein
MSKITYFNGITKLNIPTEQVLEQAKEQCSEAVVIIGYDKTNNFYFASSVADGGEVLWLLEHCKKRLLEVGEE